MIPNHDLSIRNNAIAPFNTPKFSANLKDLIRVAAREKIPLTFLTESYQRCPEYNMAGKDEYIGIWNFSMK